MAEKRSATLNWRRIALPVSVVLNLFLIALVAGHLWRRYEAPVGMPGLVRALAHAEAILSPSDAAAFGAVFRRDAPRYQAAARQFAEAREALERQITTEPYNQEAVRRALAAWQVSWDHFLANINDTLVEALGQISPEGRKELIEQRHRAEAGFHFP